MFAIAAESIAAYHLAKKDHKTASIFQRVVSLGLILSYALLNVILFGVPAFELWVQGQTPRDLRPERIFVPWERMHKAEPWGIAAGAVITTKGREQTAKRESNARISVWYGHDAHRLNKLQSSKSAGRSGRKRSNPGPLSNIAEGTETTL